MVHLLFIGLGGFFGAIGRFLITGWVHNQVGTAMPYGTLAVNVAGSFLLALLLQGFTALPELPPQLKSSITIGFLGAFTTFSTFSVDTLHFIEHGNWQKALINILLNVIICLGAAGLGLGLGKVWH
ncbi:MAG: fluoride efflux transporter CrcB [Deltaproteobacteria bacterium]|nr:fluoride efflux transporter CrcB [Candidatus Anaeroferrophillus wilburensis]MBN2889854.1 fluoride efflux transporter CrcB [Deltaproteobacteria bacterium]